MMDMDILTAEVKNDVSAMKEKKKHTIDKKKFLKLLKTISKEEFEKLVKIASWEVLWETLADEKMADKLFSSPVWKNWKKKYEKELSELNRKMPSPDMLFKQITSKLDKEQKK